MANIFLDSCSHYNRVDIMLQKYNFARGFPTTQYDVGASYALGAASQGFKTSSADLGVVVPSYTHYIVGARMKLVSTSSGNFNDIFKFMNGSTIIASVSQNASQQFFLRRGGTTLATATLTLALG